MMSAIKSGAISHSRFAKMAEMDYKVKFRNLPYERKMLKLIFDFD